MFRDPKEPDLCHPLLLDLWGEALSRLAEITTDHLGLPHRPMAAIADLDLTVVGLDEDDAYRRINQFRFLAHLQQRWLEQKTLARRLRQQAAAWQDNALRPVYAAAREELRRRHPDDYNGLLAAVRSRHTDKPVPEPRQDPVPMEAPAAAPQAAHVFVEKVVQSGWDTRLDVSEDVTTDRRHARVDATRGAAMLRVVFEYAVATGFV